MKFIKKNFKILIYNIKKKIKKKINVIYSREAINSILNILIKT